MSTATFACPAPSLEQPSPSSLTLRLPANGRCTQRTMGRELCSCACNSQADRRNVLHGSREPRRAVDAAMKQVVQDVRSGLTACRELPDPIVVPRGVLVANRVSLVSAGTEKYLVDLARKSLIAKARERPDHVTRVIE